MRKFVHKKLLLFTMFSAVAICSFSQLASNKGKEFWVGFGHHIYMETDNSMTMVIYLSAEEQAADVTVTVDSSGNPFLPLGHPAGPWTRTYHLTPFTAVSTEPIPENSPWDARLWDYDPGNGGLGGAVPFRHKGIHITSTAPITAYAHIYGGAASGATMLMPVTTWGYDYVVLSSNQQYQSNTCSWMYVIASEDNTVIEVTTPVKTKFQDISGLSPGVTQTYTLMKGHIFQVRGSNIDSDVDGNGGTSSTGYQLSGTRVKSVSVSGQCKPIAVFAGSSRTSNPISCGSGGGDNDNQQLFPMHAWGRRYLTAPFSPSTNPAGAQTGMVRIAFKDPPPATQVKRNGVTLAIPNGSLYYTYESNTADLIEANNPIMVNQFMTGGVGCMTGGNGDPEMVVVAPVEQAIKQVVFYKNNLQNIDFNFVTLIVPTEGLPSLRIDNSTAFDYTYPHPRNALMGRNYTVVVKRWPAAPGQCFIKCDSAFNAITYGLGSVESYAYSAGAQVINLNALPGIHNQPDTSNGGQNIHQFTGVGTPMDLSVLMKYQPDKITWRFSEMSPSPTGCMSTSPAFTGDYVMDPASAFYQGSVVVNNTTYYKYKLPQTFTFGCAGIYELPVEAYSPGITNCGSTEYFSLFIEVKEKPVLDFTYDYPTQCTKDTVYLIGPGAGLSGTEPMVMSQWKWMLPGGIYGNHKDTGIVLSPGTHDIRLAGVTSQGLLTDTVSKSITSLAPPVTQITAVPESVCIGQSINFSQAATYGVPGIGIENYYWNMGDNPATILSGLTTSLSHTYTAPGDYTVKAVVRISDLCIGDTATKLIAITPEAKIDFTYPVGCLPASGLAQFNASNVDWGGTPITSYTWNFGDPGSGASNTSNAQNPTHTYASFGDYDVTLSIQNSTGCSGDTTITINFALEPALTYPALTSLCATASPVSVATAAVTNGVAGTGTYSGPGTNAAGMFDPAVAGPGTHTITYSYVTPSCTETITQDITVFAPPAVSAGNYGPYCINAAPVTLAGTPAGGTFGGPGVTGNTFTPATAGAGTHTITYNYTDANGCSNSTTTSITVNALPVADAGTYAAVCINAAAVTLNGTPAGGTFSGPGVTGNLFNPSTAGAGPHTINYVYTDVNGCSASDDAGITVNALPVVNAGTYTAVCIDVSTVTLAGTPAGGTFSGPGVTGNTFNPATAGAGTHTINYSYTDANGCSNTAIPASITVNALPVVDAGTYATVCINAATVILNGTPAGGTFSGPGVTGNTFNPTTAGAGSHTIIYNYTNATGCSASDNAGITVSALPVVNAGTYTAVCIDAAPVTLTGTPAGGTFSGPGVTGNTFNPATAGAGTHNIVYSYTDASGCSATAPTSITVNALPVVNAGVYGTVCISTPSIPLNGTPAGGVFSGTGVTGNTFSPPTAGFGTHTINYSYTDANGCSNTATPTTITVNTLPVVDAGTYAAVCVSGNPITLAGTPAGGTFSGPGVTGNTFNPATAGPGTHSITYTYSDGNGCSGSDAVDIVVNALPAVNAGTYNPVCINAAAITLAGTPAGGTFSGTGVTGNSFDPATAGAGTHAINYSYTDANGCSNTATPTNIIVNALPVVNAGTYNSVCLNSAPVTLAGTPAGGTFSGTAITGNNFDPSVAGVGTHTINYSYTDANGCSNTATPTSITVNALPVVDAGTYAAVCISVASVTLNGTPAGGTFSGPGVTGNSFNPSSAGAGVHTINYSYTDANGCSNTDPASITVNALPVVDAGTYTAVCINAAAVTLNGTPAGGTFSGPGVTGNSFNPATASVGTHTIVYSYTDANGCSASAPTTITVNDLPVVNAGTYTAVCLNAGAVTLTGTPAGGTFSGPGVTGNSFNPATAGVGTHTINYSYTDPNGCSNTATPTSITVNALPAIDAGIYAAVCINAAPVTLAGTPVGGTFNGPGVTGNSFNPATAGAGVHTINYTYTDANGCSNTDPANITVNALPVVSAGTYAAVCINAATVTLNGTPAGGTFSGPGVTGNTFNPATAGAGTYTMVYSYTDANGCSASANTSITVNPLPVVNAGTYTAVCANAAAVALAGTPAGGTFSGPGITGNNFDPSVAGVGTHTINYSYTDANGCSNTSTPTSITVNALPVVNAGTYAAVCANGSPVTLAGTPAGGTFSGPGVTGNSFNPAIAGAGTHTIVYNYTNANGCSASANASIVVDAIPTVNAGTYAAVCIDANLVTLAGTPAGGVFSGPGVAGNTFNPAIAGAGNFTITYSYTSAGGCSNSATANISVNAIPVLNAGTYADVCLNAPNITLTGSPAGGIFSGPGVSGNTFDPATAGTGNFTITYSGVDGCRNSTTTSITVNPLPVVDAATSPVSLCINDPAISLVGVPNGGTFSGSGVSGSNFDPATAGVGNHPVVYTYTDVNGCTNSGTATYIVNPLPVIDAGQSFVVPMGTVIRFGATANGGNNVTYYWDPAYSLSDPSILNPTLTATTDEMYTLTATSAAGCFATDFITVKILQPVTVPNAFSPNGDGIHDTWMIRNLADYPGAVVEVFNRYGQQVFYSSGYGTAWDGKRKGNPLPVGVYYYVIQLKNGFKPITGSVTILR